MSLAARALCAIAILTAATAARADEKLETRWFAHVEALANDGMEGRNTGSPGHRRAARYVAAQFQQAGLEPAGVGGFIQPVRLKTRRIVEAKSGLALVRDGKVETLTLGEDANIGLRNDPAARVDAPLVFVGYGLRIPERQIDDLAGLDLKGAIVVHIGATPTSLPGPLQAHFGSTVERWKTYKAAGAIGVVVIPNPKSMDVPWARSTLARLQTAMSLADPEFDDLAGEQVSVLVNPAHADKILAGSGHTIAELLALVDAGKPVPSFALPARLQATMTVERAEVESQNVVGVLRGADAARRDEYVVVSGHLDHLGVGGAVNGDSIYNGAMDNAAGVGAMIEIARSLHDTGARPARSILFLATTGEEKGLLGSNYYASRPTVPASGIVANLNIDMFLPLFPMKSLMVLGLDESDLGQDIREVAKAAGLAVQADPAPQRNRFVRSDQYNFIKHGVPALATQVGYEPDSPEAAIAAKWTAERYHAPSDDLQQPIDRSAAGKYIEVTRDLLLRVADRAGRPKWNDNSFFKRFSKPAAP
jgi:Zn-dependent M28 family amino/carboxypeptidase